MTHWIPIILVSSSALVAACTRAEPHSPLVGQWSLDTAATHYGPGVSRRLSETFLCAEVSGLLRCEIRGVHESGETTAATFAARYDGSVGPVRGISGMDGVRLSRVSPDTLVAVFSLAGSPVFAYQASPGIAGESIVIEALNPADMQKTGTIVVYERVQD